MNVRAITDEALALMASLEHEPAHARHVARLALGLFDATLELHGLGLEPRLLLEMAACLHDIGWSAAPSGKGHHKESARLVREHAWKFADARFVELTAQVARYHRKRLPSLEHAEFCALPSEDRELVHTLAGLLRVADGLDRTHLQRVRHLKVAAQPAAFLVQICGSAVLDREIQGALKKADLAGISFGVPFVFQQVVSAADFPPLPGLSGGEGGLSRSDKVD